MFKRSTQLDPLMGVGSEESSPPLEVLHTVVCLCCHFSHWLGSLLGFGLGPGCGTARWSVWCWGCSEAVGKLLGSERLFGNFFLAAALFYHVEEEGGSRGCSYVGSWQPRMHQSCTSLFSIQCHHEGWKARENTTHRRCYNTVSNFSGEPEKCGVLCRPEGPCLQSAKPDA